MIYEKSVRSFDLLEDEYDTNDDPERFYQAPRNHPPALHDFLDANYPEALGSKHTAEMRVDSLFDLFRAQEDRVTQATNSRGLQEYGRLRGNFANARGRLFTEHYLLRGYLIKNMRRSFMIPQLFNREHFPNEDFQSDTLDRDPFEPSRIQYSPDGRLILFSSAEMNPTVDLTICDPHGRRIHSYRDLRNNADSPDKDICWLDDSHFAVRFSTGFPDDVEYIYDHLDNSPRSDVMNVFDIRKHSQPVESKTLPFGIRHFYPVKEPDGTSWLLGTGRMLNQLPLTPAEAELFNEGTSLMQMRYSSGCFGEHQRFPEACPITPCFGIPDELYVHWMLSSTCHVIPPRDPSDRPSLLIVKNLWQTEIFWDQNLFADWPKFKLIEPSEDPSTLLNNSAVAVRMTNRVPGFYGTMDVTPDPLGGGFLASIVSLTPMAEPPGPDRDVAVYHLVYFAIEKAEDGEGYEVVPRAVIKEPSGPGYYKCAPCFAGNGLYAVQACGNELEIITNGQDARPFAENPSGDMLKLRVQKRIRFGRVGMWEEESTCIMSATVNPSNYLDIAVLTVDGNLRIVQPKW